MSQTRTIYEPFSPFVLKPAEDQQPLVTIDPDSRRPVLLELLGSPEPLIDRLLAPGELDRVILASIGTIVASTSFFTMIALSSSGWLKAPLSAALASLTTLLALAAAFGPIYAAGLLLAARIPLARLVALLVSSAATGTLMLAACAPIPFFLLRIDRMWAGPIALMLAFLVTGAVSGARIYRMMFLFAEKMLDLSEGSGAQLNPDQRHRVGVLARVSMLITTFTLAFALWGFDAF
jgi:hypothetical protein